MLDSFEVMRVEASIAPKSVDWPRPDFSKTTLGSADGKPHVSAGDLHWDALHTCKDTARKQTLKALGAFAGIDGDRKLSVDGKREEKAKAAQAALTSLEKSQALANARAAVEQAVAKFDEQLAPSPVDPAIGAEIRQHVARLRDGERLVFITQHIADTGPSILTAPAFLSRLQPTEIEIVRKQYETTINPEIAAAKRQALDALEHCEQGWRNASNQFVRAGG